jgi:hypothetical protein
LFVFFYVLFWFFDLDLVFLVMIVLCDFALLWEEEVRIDLWGVEFLGAMVRCVTSGEVCRGNDKIRSETRIGIRG